MTKPTRSPRACADQLTIVWKRSERSKYARSHMRKTTEFGMSQYRKPYLAQRSALQGYRWCQIWQILPKITLSQKICQFFWQYFLWQKFAIFERPIVTMNINKIYLHTKTLESAAQIICLNMIYCLRNCCSVSFD